VLCSVNTPRAYRWLGQFSLFLSCRAVVSQQTRRWNKHINKQKEGLKWDVSLYHVSLLAGRGRHDSAIIQVRMLLLGGCMCFSKWQSYSRQLSSRCVCVISTDHGRPHLLLLLLQSAVFLFGKCCGVDLMLPPSCCLCVSVTFTNALSKLTCAFFPCSPEETSESCWLHLSHTGW